MAGVKREEQGNIRAKSSKTVHEKLKKANQ